MSVRAPEPRISVITPVYNGETYLAEVLAAVRSQTFEEWEHIVVNDGSTDRTDEILEEAAVLDSRLRVVSQDNAGEAVAVNRGQDLARGVYLMVVNADDPPFPDLLAELASILDSSPDVVVAYPDWIKIDHAGRTLKRINTLEYSREALIGDFCCIPGPGALIRSSALGGQPMRRPRYRLVSDYELWLRLSLVGRMQRCPQPLARWRTHSGGATASGQGAALAEEFIAVIGEFFERNDLPPDVISLRRQARSMSLYYAGFQRVFDPTVPGRRLMLRSLGTPFLRRKDYVTVRRRPLAVAAPFFRTAALPLYRKFANRVV